MPNNFYSAAASAAHCDEKKFTLQTGAAKLPAPGNSAGISLRVVFAVHRKTNSLAPHQYHAAQLAQLGWELCCEPGRRGISVVRGCLFCDALQSPPAGCCRQSCAVPAVWPHRSAR